MPLIDTIRRLARRVLWIHGTAGLAWGVIAAGLVIVVGVWIDLVWELSAEMRIGDALLAALSLPAALVIALVLGFRRARPEPDAVVRPSRSRPGSERQRPGRRRAGADGAACGCGPARSRRAGDRARGSRCRLGRAGPGRAAYGGRSSVGRTGCGARDCPRCDRGLAAPRLVEGTEWLRAGPIR